MVVKTLSNGREIIGVEVSAVDVRQYFPRDAAFIELLLGHLLIQCVLGSDFWKGRTEIHDTRLSAWLESKNFHSQPGSAPVPLALIPSGKNCFRLQPIPAKKQPEFIPALDAMNVA